MDFLKATKTVADEQSPYTGEGEDTDISGFAVRGKNGEIQIVVYSHNNDIDKEEKNTITVTIDGVTDGKVTIEHYRIDAKHSNPYAEWVRLGKPLFPEGKQYAKIKAKDRLEKFCGDVTEDAVCGKVKVTFSMPAHAISYLVVK